jgi:hypothetical protein
MANLDDTPTVEKPLEMGEPYPTGSTFAVQSLGWDEVNGVPGTFAKVYLARLNCVYVYMDNADRVLGEEAYDRYVEAMDIVKETVRAKLYADMGVTNG